MTHAFNKKAELSVVRTCGTKCVTENVRESMKCTFKVEQCNGKVSFNGVNCYERNIERHLKRNIIIRKQTKLQFLNQLLYRIQLISVMFQMSSLEFAISNIIKNNNTVSQRSIRTSNISSD